MSLSNIKEPCKYIVPAEKAPFEYNGECYQENECVWMHPDDYAFHCGVQAPTEGKPSNPWPKWELVCGVPRPAKGNVYTIEAESFVCIDFTVMPCRPDIMYLNYKGDCIMTLCNQVPGTLEEMTNHTDWSGPMINERTFLLSEDPITCEACDKLYIYNPGPGAVVVSAVGYQV